jgi:hypothetical protein
MNSKKTLQWLRQADEIKKHQPNAFIRQKHKSSHARDTLKNDERKGNNPAEQTSGSKSNSDTGHNQRNRLKQSHSNSKKEDQERRLLPKSSV